MNIIGRMKIWFGISLLTIIIGVAAISIYHLKPSIDFTGGSLLEIISTQKLNSADLSPLLTKNGFQNVTITPAGQGSMVIRSKQIDQSQKNAFLIDLNSKIGGGAKEESFETIGPTVSNDLLKKAIYSVLLASLGIICYVAFAFRKLPDKSLSWRFGISAILALAHDLLFTVGLFAIASRFFGWEVDSLFITALLTVMGFSVHDTIVVFDRLRENIKRYPGHTFASVVNASIVQTLARSLNTSLTILITLAALLLLGGQSLQAFVFTLFLGIFVGAYSSIFIASPIVVVWQNLIDQRSQIIKK